MEAQARTFHFAIIVLQNESALLHSSISIV